MKIKWNKKGLHGLRSSQKRNLKWVRKTTSRFGHKFLLLARQLGGSRAPWPPLTTPMFLTIYLCFWRSHKKKASCKYHFFLTKLEWFKGNVAVAVMWLDYTSYDRGVRSVGLRSYRFQLFHACEYFVACFLDVIGWSSAVATRGPGGRALQPTIENALQTKNQFLRNAFEKVVYHVTLP